MLDDNALQLYNIGLTQIEQIVDRHFSQDEKNRSGKHEK